MTVEEQRRLLEILDTIHEQAQSLFVRSHYTVADLISREAVEARSLITGEPFQESLL